MALPQQKDEVTTAFWSNVILTFTRLEAYGRPTSQTTLGDIAKLNTHSVQDVWALAVVLCTTSEDVVHGTIYKFCVHLENTRPTHHPSVQPLSMPSPRKPVPLAFSRNILPPTPLLTPSLAATATATATIATETDNLANATLAVAIYAWLRTTRPRPS